MRKGTHKVDFIAAKPQPVTVRFTTRDGERVKFTATKEEPTEVTFYAKDKRK